MMISNTESFFPYFEMNLIKYNFLESLKWKLEEFYKCKVLGLSVGKEKF